MTSLLGKSRARRGFSALRNVLEVVMVLKWQRPVLAGVEPHGQYVNHRCGSAEFQFGTACDQFSNAPELGVFDAQMRDLL
jgi:hypothetical protein